MSAEKKKKSSFIIIAIVAFVAAVAGGYLFQVLYHNDKESSNSSITKVDPEEDERGSDVDVSLKYAGYATLFSDKKLITLNFTNPSKSRKSLSLEIVVEIDGKNIVLAKTDKLHPGYKIDSVEYESTQTIAKGNYKGYFLVHFYNDNNEEEIVNSKIAIDIYVK